MNTHVVMLSKWCKNGVHAHRKKGFFEAKNFYMPQQNFAEYSFDFSVNWEICRMINF